MRVIFFGSCLFLVASAKPLVNTWRKRPVFPQNAEAQMAQGLSAGQVNALKIRVSTLTARFTVPDSQRETVMTVNTVSRRRFRVDVPALDALHLVARPVDLKTMIVAIGVTLLNLWMIGLFGWTALRTARERRPNASD